MIWPAIFVHGGTAVWTKATGGPPWIYLNELFPDWLKVVFIPDAKYFIVCFIAIVIAIATKGRLGLRVDSGDDTTPSS